MEAAAKAEKENGRIGAAPADGAVVLPSNTTKAKAVEAVGRALAGKPLLNDAAGIVAYINNKQRGKLVTLRHLIKALKMVLQGMNIFQRRQT